MEPICGEALYEHLIGTPPSEDDRHRAASIAAHYVRGGRPSSGYAWQDIALLALAGESSDVFAVHTHASTLQRMFVLAHKPQKQLPVRTSSTQPQKPEPSRNSIAASPLHPVFQPTDCNMSPDSALPMPLPGSARTHTAMLLHLRAYAPFLLLYLHSVCNIMMCAGHMRVCVFVRYIGTL